MARVRLQFVPAGGSSLGQGSGMSVTDAGTVRAFVSHIAFLYNRHARRGVNTLPCVAAALLVTTLVAANAFAPLRLDSPSPAPTGAHEAVQKIPAGLARAIHA